MRAPKSGGLVEDAALLIALAFGLPLVVLLVGTPIAFCIRVVVEIAHRL